MIPADDRGFLLGDGLFETLLAIDGELQALAAHLDRLDRGCAVLGLPAPDRAKAVELMRQALVEQGPGRAAVRLTLSAGSGGRGLDRPASVTPRLVAGAAASARPVGPARLVTSSVRRNAESPASRLKTLAYLDNVLARREALGGGADEALMLNTRGEVACGAAANIFWLREGRLFTPALTCGVLDGIVRAAVIEAAARIGVEVLEVAAGPGELAGAEAVFLTNSLMGVRAVEDLDGEAYTASDLVQRLAELIG